MKTPPTIKTIYLLGFIFALSVSFPGYIRSTFLEEFVDISKVGLYFTGAALVTLLVINFFPYFIKRLSNYKLSIIVLIADIASILLLITTQSPYWAFVFFVVNAAAFKLVWINMDVFLERFTKNATTGRTRTTFLTFRNMGWVIAPLIVGLLLKNGENYRLIFLMAAFFIFVVLIILLANKKTLQDHLKYEHHHTWTTIKHIITNSNLRNIFGIAFLLELFFTVAVIYMPIYLHENIGFDWLTIGFMFSFMLLPFIIFEIPAGVWADKYFGEKKIFFLGFMILITSTLLFFFTDSTSPIVWALILFLSRCGAALIESMRESYFFKIVDVKDIDYINFFRNLAPTGILIGSGISVFILLFLPIQYIFLCLAIILSLGFIFISKLKTVQPKD